MTTQNKQDKNNYYCMNTTLNEPYTGVSDAFPLVKAMLTIHEVWNRLALDGAPGRKCKSPFRADNDASFSVYSEGRRFKDFGTNDGGDVVDFYMLATDSDKATAIKVLKEWCDIKTDKLALGAKHITPSKVTSAPVYIEPTPTDKVPIFSPECDTFLKRKDISLGVLIQLIKEGSLQMEEDKMVFVYGTGRKMRTEWDSSRSNRWLTKQQGDYFPWRYEQVLDQDVEGVLITEGETDLMRVLSVTEVPKSWAVIAAPSASWRPDTAMAHAIGFGRTVVTAFDNDKAGRDGEARLHKIMGDISHNRIFSFPWDNVTEECDVDYKDLCDLPQIILQKCLDSIWATV